jgi:hypothetical protein
VLFLTPLHRSEDGGLHASKASPAGGGSGLHTPKSQPATGHQCGVPNLCSAGISGRGWMGALYLESEHA